MGSLQIKNDWNHPTAAQHEPYNIKLMVYSYGMNPRPTIVPHDDRRGRIKSTSTMASASHRHSRSESMNLSSSVEDRRGGGRKRSFTSTVTAVGEEEELCDSLPSWGRDAGEAEAPSPPSLPPPSFLVDGRVPRLGISSTTRVGMFRSTVERTGSRGIGPG